MTTDIWSEPVEQTTVEGNNDIVTLCFEKSLNQKLKDDVELDLLISISILLPGKKMCDRHITYVLASCIFLSLYLDFFSWDWCYFVYILISSDVFAFFLMPQRWQLLVFYWNAQFSWILNLKKYIFLVH